ncbi:MAG: hypothetical protein QHH13_12360 [Melioribacter sp.]|uniref:hypothetical protein n=1 Tax=Rosettibacter primus TaxID=3111523 RepID=UPI00247CE9DF|nr:hypothetical protein [Melioribacter sp.]
MSTSKLSCFIISIIFSTTLFCQNPLKRDVYTLGGTLNISYANYNYEKSSNEEFRLTASPSLGYFITDNIMISGKLGFLYFESKYTSSDFVGKSYSRQFSIGSFFRYYFNAEKFIPFLGAGIDYVKVFQTEYYSTEIFFTGGLNYFLSKEIAFEPFVSYSIILMNNISKSSNNLSIGAGINYFFTH